MRQYLILHPCSDPELILLKTMVVLFLLTFQDARLIDPPYDEREFFGVLYFLQRQIKMNLKNIF